MLGALALAVPRAAIAQTADSLRGADSARTAPLPSCSYTPSPPPAALPFDLPVDIRGNQFVVTVCHGDHVLHFILDTGARESLFDLGVAKELGIDATGSIRSGGAGAGTTSGARLRRDSVRIAGTPIVVPIEGALDFAPVSARGRAYFDGLLGADFIRRFVVALDYRNNVLRLYDARAFEYHGNGTVVPLTITQGFIYVRGEVGLVDGGRVPGRFVVDVGAGTGLSLAKPFVESNHLLERSGPTIHRRAGTGVGGTMYADIARLASFSIGDVAMERPTVFMYGDSAGVFSGVTLGDGNVGAGILRRYLVLLDYSRKRMIFERLADSDAPFEVDMTGLTLIPVKGGDGLLVESVVPNSAAAGAGIVAHDTVVAIDGKPATGQTLRAAAPRFIREGVQIAFTVRRDGQDLVIKLITKRLI